MHILGCDNTDVVFYWTNLRAKSVYHTTKSTIKNLLGTRSVPLTLSRQNSSKIVYQSSSQYILGMSLAAIIAISRDVCIAAGWCVVTVYNICEIFSERLS